MSTIRGQVPFWFVDAGEHYGNRRQRIERLVSALNQGACSGSACVGEADHPLIEASEEPRSRPRTRLTDEEVDALRTARAESVGVNVLAHRYGVHRGTVWAKTRGSDPFGIERSIPDQ